MKLSIIIPVYNSENYIIRCLDSIYNDHFPESKFEVICIDDFSKDNSISLIKSYSLSHSNLILLSHSRNLKQGAARNFGLNTARGEYVWFIDSDDFIEIDIVKILLNKLETSKPDILQFNAKTITNSGLVKYDDFLNSSIENLSGYEYLRYEMSLNYENRIRAVWSKWYNREFLLNFNLYFEECVFWEDIIHTLKAFYFAPNFVYLPIFAYNYVETSNSDLRGKLTARKFIDTIRFCNEGLRFIYENIIEYDLQLFLSNRFLSTINKYKSKVVELNIFEFVKCILQLDSLNFKIFSHFMHYQQYSWLLHRNIFFNCWIKRFQKTI